MIPGSVVVIVVQSRERLVFVISIHCSIALLTFFFFFPPAYCRKGFYCTNRGCCPNSYTLAECGAYAITKIPDPSDDSDGDGGDGDGDEEPPNTSSVDTILPTTTRRQQAAPTSSIKFTDKVESVNIPTPSRNLDELIGSATTSSKKVPTDWAQTRAAGEPDSTPGAGGRTGAGARVVGPVGPVIAGVVGLVAYIV